MKPTHFRAYAPATAKRSFALYENGEPVIAEDGTHQRGLKLWDVEDTAFDGPTTDGRAVFDAGSTTITRLVFLGNGPGDEETVIGSIDLNRSGSIDEAAPEFVGAPSPAMLQIIDDRADKSVSAEQLLGKALAAAPEVEPEAEAQPVE